MNILIISCSLRSGSRSRLLAAEATRLLKTQDAHIEFIDLLHHKAIPFCDGEDVDACVIEPLAEPIRKADAIIMAVPIYNYDVNAAAKNVIEHTGSAWENKVVGFICAAGGQGSYMSVMGIANSLMLDFRCVIVPRFVYATENDFTGEEVTSSKVKLRMEELCRRTLQLARVAGG